MTGQIVRSSKDLTRRNLVFDQTLSVDRPLFAALQWVRRDAASTKKNKGEEHFLLKSFLACPVQGKEVAYSAILNTIHVCKLNHHSRLVALKTWFVMYEKTDDIAQTIAQNPTSM